jgi:hypothetical protein
MYETTVLRSAIYKMRVLWGWGQDFEGYETYYGCQILCYLFISACFRVLSNFVLSRALSISYSTLLLKFWFSFVLARWPAVPIFTSYTKGARQPHASVVDPSHYWTFDFSFMLLCGQLIDSKFVFPNAHCCWLCWLRRQTPMSEHGQHQLLQSCRRWKKQLDLHGTTYLRPFLSISVYFGRCSMTWSLCSSSIV